MFLTLLSQTNSLHYTTITKYWTFAPPVLLLDYTSMYSEHTHLYPFHNLRTIAKFDVCVSEVFREIIVRKCVWLKLQLNTTLVGHKMRTIKEYSVIRKIEAHF